MSVSTIIAEWTAGLKGAVCWGVAAGGCVGTAFTIDAGERVKRERRLTNPNLSDEQRSYVSTNALYVQDAEWKLLREGAAAGEVITSSFDDYSPNGPIVVGLQRLVGKRISSCVVDNKTNDLTIRFLDCGFKLWVSGQIQGESTAYSLFSPSAIVSCEPSGMELE